MSECGGFGTVDRPGLPVDVAHVMRNGIQTDEQLVGNLLVGFASREQAKHLGFALREAARVDDTTFAFLSLCAHDSRLDSKVLGQESRDLLDACTVATRPSAIGREP